MLNHRGRLRRFLYPSACVLDGDCEKEALANRVRDLEREVAALRAQIGELRGKVDAKHMN